MRLKLVTIQMNARAFIVGSMESKHPSHGKTGRLLAKTLCACDSPCGSCSSADSASIGLGQGL